MIYVLGFLTCRDEVVLIKKTKPEWQKGLLNGVGGKVEDTDKSLHDAMEREFREETGVTIRSDDWLKVAIMRFGQDDEVHVFTSETDLDTIDQVKTTTEEEVSIVYTYHVLQRNLETVTNLPWLIAMCYDRQTIDTVFEVKYASRFLEDY